jgi:hypothetical protein
LGADLRLHCASVLTERAQHPSPFRPATTSSPKSRSTPACSAWASRSSGSRRLSRPCSGP